MNKYIISFIFFYTIYNIYINININIINLIINNFYYYRNIIYV